MRELILSTLGHMDHTNPSKQPKQASWVVAINDDGTVVSSIKDLTESYQSCTGLVETKDQLWLASEIEDKFAYLNKSIV